MSITELKEFAQIVERQTERKTNFENLIKKQDELIKISNDLIKKLDEEKELNKQIAELNNILDNAPCMVVYGMQ